MKHTLPYCMMPDGAEPCQGYTDMRTEWLKDREKIEKLEAENKRLRGQDTEYLTANSVERIEKLEAECDEALNAVGWIKEWLVADKFKKPDVPDIVRQAQIAYRTNRTKIKELEAEVARLKEVMGKFENLYPYMREREKEMFAVIVKRVRKLLEDE